MAYAPSANLIIAGNDEENYTPYLTNLVDQHGVNTRVTFAGPVRDGDKQALLTAAKLVVLPSYSENFGNVLLEAMAEGCPVVVTPEVGLADAVTETGSGIVIDGSPESLGSEIERLLADEKRRIEMGESGRKAAVERFAWRIVAKAMEEVYNKLLSLPPDNRE
jgi:glycosyltransferase involved in cell wall biosynthesis